MTLAAPDLPYWEVPRCFEGECVAIIAGGKSLEPWQVEHVRGRCRVIAINRAFQLAPWADWLWGCDAEHFWTWHPEATGFAGTKIVVRAPGWPVGAPPARWGRLLAALANAGVNILRHSQRDYPGALRRDGLSSDAAVVRGDNSLAQILSVISHTGAHTVLLLGADMRGGHWHRGYPTGEPDWAGTTIPHLGTMAEPLAKAGVTVMNCALSSAIPYWPKLDLRSVL